MIVKFKARRFWVMAALTLVALPAGYAGRSAANGSAGMQALIADPSSLFSARSPGGRGIGALAQTKPGYVRTGPATDEFLGFGPQVGEPLADGITGPGGPGVSDDLGIPLNEDLAAFSIPGGLYGPAESGPIFGSIGGDGLAGGGIGFGSGTGGGNGGGGGGGLPGGGTTPTAPPAAVPEPDMWLMLIVGFSAIGSMMRAGNRRAAASRL